MGDVEASYNQAMAAWRRGEIDDYEALHQVVESGDEQDPRTQHALGWVHRERGGHDAADQAFSQALLDGRFGCDAQVWAACGDARLACARFDEAADAYRRAQALAPGDVRIRGRLADAEARRRPEVATWLAGAIEVGKKAGARLDCIGVGARHAAVLRSGDGHADGRVTIHALSEQWNGTDDLIHDQPGSWMAAAPGGDRVAIGTAAGTAVWSLSERRTTTELPAMSAAVWLDDDRLIASFADGGFALMSAHQPLTFDEWRMPAPVNGVELLPGGRFAVCTTTSTVDLLDLRGRDTIARWPLTADPPQIAVRDDGSLVALLTATTLTLWDPAQRRRVGARAVVSPRRGLRFWPDGDHLLSGGERVELWEVATGRVRHIAALRGRLVVHGVHGFVVPEDRPEATDRLINRIRLGSLPASSPELTPRPPLSPHLLIRPPTGAPYVHALGEVTIIGWHDSCQLRLRDDPYCSTQHCRVRREVGGFVLEDLGSTRGTIVNDRLLRAAQVLAPRDLIRVGDHLLSFG